MKALLFYDLTTKALTDGTSAWTPPSMVFGESLILGLRFQETTSGVQSEVSRTVNYLKAGSGSVDERPVAGVWRLKIGGTPQSDANTTAPLQFNASAVTLQSAINALPEVVALYGTAVVTSLAESYLLKFGAGAVDVPLDLVESQLHPPCFNQVNAWQVAGAWVAELRLVQAPVVFSDSSERRLPSAPTITRIQAGGADGAGFEWNEIQQMVMPPEFRGSYQFKFGNRRTVLLSRADGPDEMTAALSVYGSAITATNPRDTVARFEFGGIDFKGTPQPLLQVIVVDAPEGDLTFTLSLDKAPLAAMLRAKESVTLPLEIELGIAEDAADGGVAVHKIRTEITIERGVIFPMLAAAAGIEWLRPVAKDYVPFTRDQIITGQQFYACALGDGEKLEFTVDHNLATDAVAAVLLRENHVDGRMLVLGTDYSVTVGGMNSLTVTLLGAALPPDTAGLGLVITAAGPAAVFQAHTHTITQVIGLDTVLEEISERLTHLESFLPSTSPSVSDAVSALSITIPTAEQVVFYSPAASTSKTATALDLTALPVRPPYLLPAVHQAADAIALPTPLPQPTMNTLWTSAARELIPGTGRIASSYVEAGGFVVSDGRFLYPARRAGATTSYYPAAFEQPLFEFGINDDMLTVGRVLDVKFGVTFQLVNASSEAQWVLVIEQGMPVDQSDPANTDLNLQDVIWSPIPILKKRIMLTPLATLHTFGCRIKRTDTGLTADKMLYGAWTVAANSAPATANFVLRARLIEFDTKNNVPDATGWVYCQLGAADDSKTSTKATIA